MRSISEVASDLTKQHIKHIEAQYHLQNERLIRERRDLMENGEQIGVVDAMIGATALSTQQTVLTNNATEFTRLGCTVERY